MSHARCGAGARLLAGVCPLGRGVRLRGPECLVFMDHSPFEVRGGAGFSVQSRAREARVPLREKPSRMAPPAGRVRRSGRRVQFKEVEAEGPRQVVG